MLSTNESSPRLRIVNYFDSVINYLDISCEKLLAQNQGPSKQIIKSNINDVRENFIKSIEVVKSQCLELFNTTQINLNQVVHFEDKNLFKRFCFILKSEAIEPNVSLESPFLLGYLILTEHYVSPEEIEILITILRISFGNDELLESILECEQENFADNTDEDDFKLSVSII
jgi:hypothetical protein